MSKSGRFRDGEDLASRVVYRIISLILTGFAKIYWRLSLVGKENLPEGVFVLAPSHRSNVDTPILAAVPHRLRFMAKDSLFKNKAVAWGLKSMGSFPVNRDAVDREALSRCIAMLEQGDPVVIFPEGTRQSGPMIQPLFDGAAYVAAKTQAPIIPVGIGGTEKVMPKGAKMLYPRKLRIIFGEPMAPPPLKENGRISRSAVKQCTEELALELQRLFDMAQASVGEARSGAVEPTSEETQP